MSKLNNKNKENKEIKAKKSKKLSDLNQIDGKLRPEEEENGDNKEEDGGYEITSLDQLYYGDAIAFNKYKTLDLEEYETQLGEMNTAELRRHAVEVAHVIPSTSADRLKRRLVLEFKKHVLAVRMPKITHRKEKSPSAEALKIMSEVK